MHAHIIRRLSYW